MKFMTDKQTDRAKERGREKGRLFPCFFLFFFFFVFLFVFFFFFLISATLFAFWTKGTSEIRERKRQTDRENLITLVSCFCYRWFILLLFGNSFDEIHVREREREIFSSDFCYISCTEHA